MRRSSYIALLFCLLFVQSMAVLAQDDKKKDNTQKEQTDRDKCNNDSCKKPEDKKIKE